MKKYLTGITKSVFNPGPYTRLFSGLTCFADDTCKHSRSIMSMYSANFKHPNAEHTCRMIFVTCSIIIKVFQIEEPAKSRNQQKFTRFRVISGFFHFRLFQALVVFLALFASQQKRFTRGKMSIT